MHCIAMSVPLLLYQNQWRKETNIAENGRVEQNMKNRTFLGFSLTFGESDLNNQPPMVQGSMIYWYKIVGSWYIGIFKITDVTKYIKFDLVNVWNYFQELFRWQYVGKHDQLWPSHHQDFFAFLTQHIYWYWYWDFQKLFSIELHSWEITILWSSAKCNLEQKSWSVTTEKG